MAVATLQIGLLLACATLGRTDEIRLLMPTFSVALCVGALTLARDRN